MFVLLSSFLPQPLSLLLRAFPPDFLFATFLSRFGFILFRGPPFVPLALWYLEGHYAQNHDHSFRKLKLRTPRHIP